MSRPLPPPIPPPFSRRVGLGRPPSATLGQGLASGGDGGHGAAHLLDAAAQGAAGLHAAVAQGTGGPGTAASVAACS
jgi:hypothetical protein